MAQAQATTRFGPTVMLLERDDEVEEMAAAPRDAGAGHGRVVLVEGEAGIGKTSLLHTAERAAVGLDGVLVARARGGELERDFAFGVVRQPLEPLVSAGTLPHNHSMRSTKASCAGCACTSASRSST